MEMIKSRRSAAAAHMKKLGSNREYRHQHGEFLCDGIRLLNEAVAGDSAVTAVFIHENALEKYGELLRDVPVFAATAEVMLYISPLKTPQDVIFSCRMRQTREIDVTVKNIVLDGVQDPGNVGTAIRAAAAFGIGSVILTGACADLYNPKTVRATMGAIFRQNVIALSCVELEECVRRGLVLYGAALGEGSEIISAVSFDGVSAAVGSEGAGLSREVLALCEKRVIIPMEPHTESLNAGVAASILMWEMYRGGRHVNC